MKTKNVAVIGCGAVGITSALAIQHRLDDANVTIFTKDVSPDTTSDIAAGLWEPYLLQDTPPDKIYQWSRDTYEYLLRLWKEGKAAEAGITLQPVMSLTDKEHFVLPDWLKLSLGYAELPRHKLLDIGERLGQELTGGFQFITFVWEASIFIPFLMKEFIANGGQIVRKYILDLEELHEFDVIVNCTGLGAKEIVGDWQLKPVRGQVIRVKAPWQNQIILADTEYPAYIIPNTTCVILGGTKQEEYNLQVDEIDKQRILRNCSILVPSIKSAEIIKHQVGLRPARDKVRLEAEIRGNGKNGAPVVHNYGHGGAGITLSVGCAREAAELVEIVLNRTMRSKL